MAVRGRLPACLGLFVVSFQLALGEVHAGTCVSAYHGVSGWRCISLVSRSKPHFPQTNYPAQMN